MPVGALTLVVAASSAPIVAAAPTPTTPLNCPPSAVVWIPVISALIGAAAAIVTPFIKDLFIGKLNDQRVARTKQKYVFRHYIAPLADACEKLAWRFGEIFIEKRHQWLKTATLPLEYNEYKRKSTLYRMASLLGWIRALNLELNALPRGGSGFVTPITRAIGAVRGALADGPHVELHRLERICAVWEIDLRGIEDARKRSLATQLEVKLYNLAGGELKRDSEFLKKMDDQKKFGICEGLSQFLCSQLHRTPLDQGVLAESIHKAISSLRILPE